MAGTMRSSLVLPPLVTSPQTGPQPGVQTLDSFSRTYIREGQGDGHHTATSRSWSHSPAGNSTLSLGHGSVSAASNPVASQCAPSPTKGQGKSPERQGKSPDRRSKGKGMDMTVEQNGAGGDDIITLFPRRKAGQSRPGGGKGPVVLNLELLEQFYGMPLHVAANRLGICQTAIKKVCRRLGIMKWPYKEMRMPSERFEKGDDKGEAADNSDAASDETSASLMDTPRDTRIEALPTTTKIGTTVAATMPRQDDAEVKAAVTALLSLHSV